MLRYYGQENVPGAPLSGMRTMEFVPGRDSANMQPLPYMGGGFGIQPLGVAGTPSFDINRRPGSLGGRSGEQLKRIYEGGTQQNEQLNEELRKRGIMPGGPQLPLAQGFNAVPGAPGNFNGVQLAQAQRGDGQQILQDYFGALMNPMGFIRKTQGVANQIQERNQKQQQMIDELLYQR